MECYDSATVSKFLNIFICQDLLSFPVHQPWKLEQLLLILLVSNHLGLTLLLPSPARPPPRGLGSVVHPSVLHLYSLPLTTNFFFQEWEVSRSFSS